MRDDSGLVFHGHRHGTPMSDMTLTAVLRRMGRGDLTAHGFRSSFRDWVAETTAAQPTLPRRRWRTRSATRSVAAYQRTDLFDPRRRLMADWAAYLSRPPAEVVALRAG